METSLTKIYSKKNLLLLCVLLIALLAFYRCLPQPLFNAPVSSILLSDKEQLLGAHIAKDGQWRFPYNDSVPQKFKTAIVELFIKFYC